MKPDEIGLHHVGTNLAITSLMRRVLRHTQTGRFVKAAGEDTTHFENGQPFCGFSDALIFCVDRELEGVELVLLDENGEEQVCMRLT